MATLRNVVALMLICGCLFAYTQVVSAVDLPFIVYKDRGPGSHYVASGRMGDTSDIRMTYASSEEPYSGKTCIKITYTAEMSRGSGWAGVYWQYPANNWGEKRGGYDLTGAKEFTFWVKGKQGGEIVEFKIGGIIGTYGDTDQASTGPIQLSSEWEEYTLDTSELDLSNIIGGFCFAVSALDNPDGAIFYLDDIVYK